MLPSGGDFCGDIAQELQEDRDERGEGCISGDDGMKLAVQGDRADRRRGRVAAPFPSQVAARGDRASRTSGSGGGTVDLRLARDEH